MDAPKKTEKVEKAGDMKKDLDEVSDKIYKEGMLPKDAIGLSDEMMEAMYAQAYRLYNSGRYKDAQQLFQFLVMLNTFEKKYALGLAACFHMMKEYQNAANSYSLCAVLDQEDPMPYYYASDCYLQQGKDKHAMATLQLAMHYSKGKKAYDRLVDRGKMTFKALEEKIQAKEGKKKKKKTVKKKKE